MTWRVQLVSVIACISAFGEDATEAGEPDRDDEYRALEHVLGEGRSAEDVEAVETEGDDEGSDESAEHVELAVAQRRRSEEDGSEGGEQIGIGGARRAAAEPRGEQDTGDGGTHARNHEAEDLDAVDIDAGKPGRRRIAANRLNFLAERGALDQQPEPQQHQHHDHDVVGDAEQPAPQRELQEGLRYPGDDRYTG